MRFALAVLACVLAVANAQLNRYNNYGQYRPGQYQQGQYNRYQPFNKYNNNQAYRPFVTSTPYPTPARATASVTITPAPVAQPVIKVVPVVKATSDARSAEILKSGSDISPDGSYNYFFETNNGIAAQAQGVPRSFPGNPPVVPVVSQGAFSWVSPEGQAIDFTYVADENGYQPQSNAIPTPPPVSAQIARALEYASRYAKN